MAAQKNKDFFLQLKQLIAIEERDEFDEIRTEFASLTPTEKEFRGRALLNLKLDEKHYSPAGHLLATFTLEGQKDLPIFTLQEGDMVSMVSHPPVSDEIASATVYDKTKNSLTIAFRESDRDMELLDVNRCRDIRFELHRSINRVTYKRMMEAMQEVYETQNTRLADLRDISIGDKEAKIKKSDAEDIKWQDVSLNASQKKAVGVALAAKDIAIVHGPPGTGKTRVLVEIIRQALLKKQSVFATAPSNTACDNLLDLLVSKGVNALRLGHPARISESLREHTLDFKLALHPTVKFIQKAEAELQKLYNKKERYDDRRSPGRDAERELRQEISFLRQEIRSMEKEVFQKVMRETQVFVGTPTSIQDKNLRDKEFDWVVIDEASQATEPISWIPITRASKVIMAGDHFQLPPTVRSKEAEAKGLGITLFERFYEVLKPESKALLDRQYRMNKMIMGFSSKIFYEDRLIADESVKDRTLWDLVGTDKCSDASKTFLKEPFVFIDTAGKGFEEKLELGSESRYNPEEAELVIDQLRILLEAGVPESEIAIICPYSAQVRYLNSKDKSILHPYRFEDVEIDSVDGFQGREKEVVIVSLVRSNLLGEMGFLGDTRRMNVAMTRAKRKLIVIGDSSTLASLAFYKSFIEYAEKNDAYKTVWEL